jgi:hypothetical protein
MNEYVQTRSVMAPFEGILHELADADPVERYTYVFEKVNIPDFSPNKSNLTVDAEHATNRSFIRF